MIRKSIVAIVVLLALSATAAWAGNGKEGRPSETLSLFGGGASLIGGYGGAQDVVGVQYQLHIPMGKSGHWTASPAAGYGYGHYKDETSGLTSSTDDITASMYEGMLDFLYYGDCCNDDDFYCGPGVYYSSLKLKEKETGFPDVTSDPYNSYGVQMTMGGGIPMGPKLELIGSMTERIGMTTYDHTVLGTEDKLSSITHSTQFSGGVRIRL